MGIWNGDRLVSSTFMFEQYGGDRYRMRHNGSRDYLQTGLMQDGRKQSGAHWNASRIRLDHTHTVRYLKARNSLPYSPRFIRIEDVLEEVSYQICLLLGENGRAKMTTTFIGGSRDLADQVIGQHIYYQEQICGASRHSYQWQNARIWICRDIANPNQSHPTTFGKLHHVYRKDNWKIPLTVKETEETAQYLKLVRLRRFFKLNSSSHLWPRVLYRTYCPLFGKPLVIPGSHVVETNRGWLIIRKWTIYNHRFLVRSRQNMLLEHRINIAHHLKWSRSDK